MKKTIAIIIAAIMAVSAATVSASAVSVDDAANNYPVSASVGFGNYRSNSPVYRALYDTISECGQNGATGYTICKVHGSHAQHLVVSYGQAEMSRYYEVYKITDDGVLWLGIIGGSHTVAYIDDMSGRLNLFRAHMGAFGFGSVWVDGGLRVEYSSDGTVESGDAYPSIPGHVITFNNITDFYGISNF